ncbi:SAM-dependent methyltransferase [Bosea sp. F3-2]|uniref:SAM-dependent methyltransferase n=1 Tax=Bosea sp. F3-2 TaxID=2599640 RepID=UPI0011EF584E|nr:SAM-dependent methyltransferase [Bosea sp. F3-2]QEL22725.1 SAM-dependent methyltransferase [Bosea sp. F3-2]
MAGDQSSHAPMEGGGFYNRNSAPQAAGIALLADIWLKACNAVPLGNEPVRIVDLASSQGRNSMAPMRIAIDVVRRRAGLDRTIEIVHVDLPSNDFSSLFNAVIDDQGSYLHDLSGVFPLAIGRSYFEPLLPPGSVHLAWNTWSMQWMSRSPMDAPDHVLAGMSRSEELLSALAAQQRDDWIRFLALRSTELRAGGRLLTAFTARTDAETGWEWLLGELWQAIRDLADQGVLSRAETERMTIPIGLRRLEDLAMPFGKQGEYSNLRIEHLELKQAGDPHWAEFQRTSDHLDFARRHAETTRAWAGPTLALGLDAHRSRKDALDAIFSRHAERLARDPRPHQPYMAVGVFAKSE